VTHSPIQRSLVRAAGSRFAEAPRRLASRALGGRVRVVRVCTGVARGARLALDLGTEKAYWLGIHEPETQAFLLENLRAGDVVYDVGAHIGYFSVCAARLGARVYAFEPSHASAARIRRQAELNELPIVVVEAGVWDSSSGVHLVARDSEREARTAAGGPLASVCLDDFALDHEPPSLVKIDVEGAEAHVLRGAADLLRTNRPTVLCELHGHEVRDEVRSLLGDYELAPVGGEWRIAATAPAPAR
jgi:FkbM family methyltransferase